jgi:ABC-type uncharacterized transport system substrate-binding protein
MYLYEKRIISGKVFMIRSGKQILCLILFFSILFAVSDAVAHPHVFIAQRLNIVFDDKGLAGFRVEWNFDEMFSNMIAVDYDQNHNSTLEPGEVAIVKEKAFSYIAEYDYFVFVKIDGRPFKVRFIKNFNAVLEDGRLSYRFFVPCHVKANKSFKQIIIATYDPSYYTAIFFARNQPASVENAEPFVIESSIREDKSTSIYFGMLNPWALFVKFRLKP